MTVIARGCKPRGNPEERKGGTLSACRPFEVKQHMKKISLFILILVFVDQILKLIVANYFMDYQTVLIDGVLSFHPNLNADLAYFLRGINISPVVMTVIGVVQVAIFVFFGRYFAYLLGDRKSLTLYYIFASSGIAMAICRIIDVVCWGGSLDFIGLYGILYDVKDIYFFGIMLFYILLILFIKRRIRLSKEERKEKGFYSWIKKGCPLFERPL